MEINIIFQLVILIFSVIIHEVSHGAMALYWGDRTAEYEGRLTLNPIKHIDPFGSVILPLILVLTGSKFLIGWAKPVPYNPYNLRNPKIAEPLIALAGPASNLFVALIFGLVIRFSFALSFITPALLNIFAYVVLINILLAIFNLIPIPPLDGSKILFSFFPNSRFAFTQIASRYGLLLIIALFFFLPNLFSGIINPIVGFIFSLITGIR